MTEMYCERCGPVSAIGTIFCPKCRQILKFKKSEEDMNVQRNTNLNRAVTKCVYCPKDIPEGDKEEYPIKDIEIVGDKVIISVSKYCIKMEVYEAIIENERMIVYERAILPSEVDYNLFILRYIVNDNDNGSFLNGTKRPFHRVGRNIAFTDIDTRVSITEKLDITTWNTLRVWHMDPIIKRHCPIPFDPVTRAKGDRIRLYVDPEDISRILVKIIKIDRTGKMAKLLA